MIDLRQQIENAILTKFNPNHDRLGRFASSNEEGMAAPESFTPAQTIFIQNNFHYSTAGKMRLNTRRFVPEGDIVALTDASKWATGATNKVQAQGVTGTKIVRFPGSENGKNGHYWELEFNSPKSIGIAPHRPSGWGSIPVTTAPTPPKPVAPPVKPATPPVKPVEPPKPVAPPPDDESDLPEWLRTPPVPDKPRFTKEQAKEIAANFQLFKKRNPLDAPRIVATQFFFIPDESIYADQAFGDKTLVARIEEEGKAWLNAQTKKFQDMGLTNPGVSSQSTYGFVGEHRVMGTYFGISFDKPDEIEFREHTGEYTHIGTSLPIKTKAEVEQEKKAKEQKLIDERNAYIADNFHQSPYAENKIRLNSRFFLPDNPSAKQTESAMGWSHSNTAAAQANRVIGLFPVKIKGTHNGNSGEWWYMEAPKPNSLGDTKLADVPDGFHIEMPKAGDSIDHLPMAEQKKILNPRADADWVKNYTFPKAVGGTKISTMLDDTMPGRGKHIDAATAARDAIAMFDKFMRVPKGKYPWGSIPVKFGAGRRFWGVFKYLYNGSAESLGVRSDLSKSQTFSTVVHELGHYWDFCFGASRGYTASYGIEHLASQSNTAVGKWARLVYESSLYKHLRGVRDGTTVVRKRAQTEYDFTYGKDDDGQAIVVGRTPKPERWEKATSVDINVKHIKYLMQTREMWARACEQYFATRLGREDLLKITENDANDGAGDPTGYFEVNGKRGRKLHPDKWTHKEFEPIAKAMDEIFIELGLAKRVE